MLMDRKVRTPEGWDLPQISEGLEEGDDSGPRDGLKVGTDVTRGRYEFKERKTVLLTKAVCKWN